jgi:hypothetical protein
MKIKTNIPLTLAGLFLALFAWFNPLGLDILIRVALFILGFDMIEMPAKLAVFALNFFFPVFGDAFGIFSWTLLFLFMSELIIAVIEVERPYRMFVKPVAAFATAFLSLGLQPALIIAGVDLVINLTQKISRKKKTKLRKK